MPEIIRGGTSHRQSLQEVTFQLERARGEIHSLSRQVVKLRVIIHGIIDELPAERAARLRLELERVCA